MKEREDYERRMGRVMDYIDAHLGEEMTLEELAGEAAFSVYHFHRIFSAWVGEPVAGYVRRLRLERAAGHLMEYPGRTVTETAMRNGFGSAAVFARAFRERFGMSASEWRREKRKECKAVGKEGKEMAAGPRYALPSWSRRNATAEKEKAVEVRIEEMPAVRAAYVRRMGAYAKSATEAWAALCGWAGPRGLLGPGRMMFSISHDDPTVTEAGRLRYDACVEIGAETKVEGAVGVVELPARRVAKARYVGPGSGILGAYQALYRDWLPESGFEPAESPVLEVYYPEQGCDAARDRFVLDICLPVRPA